ncbi:MAG: hypothetical protein KDC05_03145 [Bacteroidales bacterium]|nr:hypothetical protein [Bacteroidales bacterium]
MQLTYHSYLKIEELLSLQEFKSKNEHDEMLFIIIHQVYELWFKEFLHEIDFINAKLKEGDVARAGYKMKRILTILKVMVHQVDILETMSPLEFLSFRDFLESASGFQSWQFRELEFALGHKSEQHLKRFEDVPAISKRLKQRYYNPGLWEVFLQFLDNAGYHVSPKKETTIEDNKKNRQAMLVHIYKTNPAIAQFCELLVDLDEGLQEWRYRHVKMVERTIGAKTGTGGSPGVKYLQKTLFNPLFPDLWEIRTSFEK